MEIKQKGRVTKRKCTSALNSKIRSCYVWGIRGVAATHSAGHHLI